MENKIKMINKIKINKVHLNRVHYYQQQANEAFQSNQIIALTSSTNLYTLLN